MSNQLALGIDLGTSGVRSTLIDEQENILVSASEPFPETSYYLEHLSQDPELWWEKTTRCIQVLLAKAEQQKIDIKKILKVAVDGTSGTLLLTDKNRRPIGPALMYNSGGFEQQAQKIDLIAPAGHICRGSQSALARLLFLLQNQRQNGDVYAWCQAGWISALWREDAHVSDYNNMLKLGYDPVLKSWPQWFKQLPLPNNVLPKVLNPGAAIGPINQALAKQLGLSENCQIHAGTTDSIAAYLAAKTTQTGEAVTSLGTTLAIKINSNKQVELQSAGIYSHRLQQRWLVGGASNVGAGIFKKLFTTDEIKSLTSQLQPDQPTGLSYYPLIKTGERFPVNDPSKKPVLEPIPDDKRLYFQGLLESIALIERQAYEKLNQLGAPYPSKVFTCGGGSTNASWTQIRAKTLGVPVVEAASTDAAYGVARLALLNH